MKMKTSSEIESFSFSSRLRSFSDAWNGLMYAVYNIHNLWLQIIISILVTWIGFLLGISGYEWCFIIFAVGLVIAAEIFNAAVEFLADAINPGDEEITNRIKSISAAAVFVAAITAVLIGLVVFVPHVLKMKF